MGRFSLAASLLATLLFVPAPARSDPAGVEYDPAGRLSRVTYASGAVVEYEYDPDGNLLRRRICPCDVVPDGGPSDAVDADDGGADAADTGDDGAPGDDAASGDDAGADADAGGDANDATPLPDAGQPGSGSGGCGCRTAGRGQTGGVVLVGLALLAGSAFRRRRRRAAAALAVGLLAVALLLVPRATRGGDSKDLSALGSGDTMLTTGDPISAATGEFFFSRRFLDLGGPLPLTYDVLYGSQLSWTRAALTARFADNHRDALSRMHDGSAERIYLMTGGREVGFRRMWNGWRRFPMERLSRELRETPEYYYLLDPAAAQVRTFVKANPNPRLGVIEHPTLAATLAADGMSSTPAITTDGRFVAFRSSAANLVAGDTNGMGDIFLRDRETATTVRVSVASDGTQAGGDSWAPAVSADGRLVAFHSYASNLVPGDLNGDADVFVHDTTTGATRRVSVSGAGLGGDGASYQPALSADGSLVAFYSAATNLVPGDVNGVRDVFVHDVAAATTELVSVAGDGTRGDGASVHPALSADGNIVVFSSDADTLVPGDSNGVRDVFARDRSAGTTARVSVSSAGLQGDGAASSSAERVDVSADGRLVVFTSSAANLVAGDLNGRADVFLRDRTAGTTSRVSVTTAGAEGNGTSSGPAISADGRLVAFRSETTNLFPGDFNGSPDVFVRDLAAGLTLLASRSHRGFMAGDGSSAPDIASSGDVAFESFADNLNDSVTDANGFTDIFVAGPVSDPEAFLVRVEDGSGNALDYEFATLDTLAERGPDRVTDGLGRSLDFTYTVVPGPDPNPRLTRVQDQTGRSVTLVYEDRPADNPSGVALRSIADPLGAVTRFAYADRNRVSGVERPEGNIPFEQSYPAGSFSGAVTSQTDAYGNVTTFTADVFDPYVAETSQFTVVYPDGSQRVFRHVHQGRVMDSMTDPLGRTIEFDSDPTRDQVTGATDRLGGRVTFAYHASGLPESVTNAAGDELRATYTPREQTFVNPRNAETVAFTFHDLVTLEYPDGAVEEYTYDGRGNLVGRVDRRGGSWTYQVNARGQVTRVTDPLGGLVDLTYNADGTVASWDDSDVGALGYAYDAAKRVSEVVWPDATRTRYVYDAAGRIREVEDERGGSTLYDYDANGNLTRVTDPAGAASVFAYDLMDRLVSATDRTARSATYAYDALGRLQSVTGPDGLPLAFGRDPAGRPVTWSIGGAEFAEAFDPEGIPTSSTTPLGLTTTATTDARGAVTGVEDPTGATFALTRDAMGRVLTTTDPLGRVTSFAYEPGGLLAAVTAPDASTATFVYDARGALTGLTDFGGDPWSFAYTAAGRLASHTDPLGRETLVTYDSRGRVATVTSPDGSTMTATWDAAGNLVRRRHSAGPDVACTYDAAGRRTGAGDVALTLDAEGRVLTTSAGGMTSTAGRDAAGRLATLAYPGGALTVTYSWDAATGLPASVSDSLTGTLVEFAYDADRRLVSITRSNGVDTAYSWDGAGRLARVQEGSFIDVRLTRDAAGQLTVVDLTAPLDPGDELLALAPLDESFEHDAAEQVTTAGWAYDERGRLTASPGMTFAWDDASRLIAAGPATLDYDGYGEPAARTEGGTTTLFHASHALPAGALLAERDEASGEFLRFYVWSPAGSLLYLIEAAAGDAVRFYHFDQVGSTLALTDETGTVTDSYAYEPYGRLLAHVGTSDQLFTYGGRGGVRQEGSSGVLYRMGERYYDAGAARFLTREPMWPMIGEPQLLNPYQYAAGDPLQRCDAQGLAPCGIHAADDFDRQLADLQRQWDAARDKWLAAGAEVDRIEAQYGRLYAGWDQARPEIDALRTQGQRASDIAEAATFTARITSAGMSLSHLPGTASRLAGEGVMQGFGELAGVPSFFEIAALPLTLPLSAMADDARARAADIEAPFRRVEGQIDSAHFVAWATRAHWRQEMDRLTAEMARLRRCERVRLEAWRQQQIEGLEQVPAMEVIAYDVAGRREAAGKAAGAAYGGY